MKTIIAGSRSITDYNILLQIMKEIDFNITEIVSGTAKGADSLGERYAIENNIPLKKFPADWNKWGKVAGRIRNGQMNMYSDALILLWDGKSRGSKHMLEIAKERGLIVFVKII